MLILIHYLIGIIISFISIYGYGSILVKKKDPFFIFLLGYLFLGTLSFLLHFFFPISIFISSSIIFFGFVLFFLFREKFELNFYILVIIIFSLLLIGKSDHPIDSNLYHHPYISYLQTEKIILGITNLHSRFGHISFLQFVQAIYSNNFLSVYSLSNINIIFYSIFFIYLFRTIFYDKNNNWIFILAILISSFLSIKFARYREYGNDLIPFIVATYFLMKILNLSSNLLLVKKIDLLTYLPIFVYLMLTHKITYLFTSLIFVSLINKQTLIIYLKEKKNIFILLLSIIITCLWLSKNLLESSCLIYPIVQTCFNNLSWYPVGESNPIAAMINAEAWSKGWIDQPSNMKLGMVEFSQSFNWLNVWFGKHFIKILEIVSPIFIAMILIKIVSMKDSKKIKKKDLSKNIYKKILINLSIFNLIGLIIWFLNAPIFRYGSFYIVTFLILIFLIINYQSIYNISYSSIKKLRFIFIIFLLIFSYKNLDRIYKSDNLFFAQTRPMPNQYNEVYNNEIKIIKPKKKLGICYFPKNICTHLKIEKLKVDKIRNYFLIKN
jgi:hypothetical protein